MNGTLESPRVIGNRRGTLLQLMDLQQFQVPRRLNIGEGEVEEVAEEDHQEAAGAGAEVHL